MNKPTQLTARQQLENQVKFESYEEVLHSIVNTMMQTKCREQVIMKGCSPDFKSAYTVCVTMRPMNIDKFLTEEAKKHDCPKCPKRGNCNLEVELIKRKLKDHLITRPETPTTEIPNIAPKEALDTVEASEAVAGVDFGVPSDTTPVEPTDLTEELVEEVRNNEYKPTDDATFDTEIDFIDGEEKDGYEEIENTETTNEVEEEEGCDLCDPLAEEVSETKNMEEK